MKVHFLIGESNIDVEDKIIHLTFHNITLYKPLRLSKIWQKDHLLMFCK